MQLINIMKKIVSIEKGKKANFVILEKDPLEVELSELEKIQVVETIFKK